MSRFSTSIRLLSSAHLLHDEQIETFIVLDNTIQFAIGLAQREKWHQLALMLESAYEQLQRELLTEIREGA